MNKQQPGFRKPHRKLVLIKGAGDLATGVAHRLYRAGFRLVMTEQERPTVIRRPVSFARAVFDSTAEVEGIVSKKLEYDVSLLKKGSDKIAGFDVKMMQELIDRGLVPVLVDPCLTLLFHLSPEIFIDATMAKKNTGINLDYAPLVIALGPGFKAGQDVHAVVETKRGHYLGRVIYDGEALPNDGVPGAVEDYSTERLIKAPVSGIFKAELAIGDLVSAGDTVGRVGDTLVRAKIEGIIRGLVQHGLEVKQGMKIGDIDPRKKRDYCFTISDKARAVGGGVLEAIMALE